MELEAAVIAAHEEISRKDDEIVQLKGLLAKIIEERDEFQTKCEQHALEKELIFKQVQVQALECSISSDTTSNEDDNNALSSSDDNIVVSKDTLPLADVTDSIPIKKALPEQGKFLQAVMDAGPLLQTLLLAGPLPQWQHPPPQMNSVDIPPVTMSSLSPRSKRGIHNNGVSDFSPTSKYQKICSPLIN